MIKILATICALAAPHNCREVTVTTSDFASVTMTGCLMGVPQLAEWMRERPAYRLAGWRCELGKREHRGI